MKGTRSYVMGRQIYFDVRGKLVLDIHWYDIGILNTLGWFKY